MFFLQNIYSSLKDFARKILNIPVLGLLIGYSLSSILFENNSPELNVSIAVLSHLPMLITLFQHNPLLNIGLILQQNLLSLLKVTPIFLIYGFTMQNILSIQELASIFSKGFELFPLNIIAIESTWEGFLFSSLIFTPLIFFISHKIFPWVYSGQELTETSKIANVILFSDRTQLNFKKVLDNFKQSCKDSYLPEIKLYIIPSPFLNAYALGNSPSNSSIFINIGLINSIIRNNDFNKEKAYRQINAVLAHEIGHVLNKHPIKQILLFTLIEFFFYKNESKLGLFLSMLFSRRCEYEADNHAASLGYGQDLIDGLKIMSGEMAKSNSITNSFSQYFQTGLIELQDTVHALKEWKSTHPTYLNRYENIRHSNPLSILVSEKPYVEARDENEYFPSDDESYDEDSSCSY